MVKKTAVSKNEQKNHSKLLVGVLMVAVVVVLAGTLVSLDALGGFDFTGNSLTGANTLEVADSETENNLIQDPENYNETKKN
jgi:FlaG/FlaF family flagellin (archaellin)